MPCIVPVENTSTALNLWSIRPEQFQGLAVFLPSRVNQNFSDSWHYCTRGRNFQRCIVRCLDRNKTWLEQLCPLWPPPMFQFQTQRNIPRQRQVSSCMLETNSGLIDLFSHLAAIPVVPNTGDQMPATVRIVLAFRSHCVLSVCYPTMQEPVVSDIFRRSSHRIAFSVIQFPTVFQQALLQSTILPSNISPI